MRILVRYIGRTVLSHVAVVLLVLLAMYFFSNFVAELEDVGRGNYDFFAALQYTVLLIPRQAYELFPLVALLGTMLGLGALANTSELTVMQAAGVSVRQVVSAVFKVGLLMVVVVTVLGEGIAPPLEKYARIERAKAMERNISVNTRDGLWARDGDTFININRLLPGAIATGVLLYRFDEQNRLTEMTYARTAEYQGNVWHLQGVTRNYISEEGVRTEYRPEGTWRSGLRPRIVDIVAVPPENLSVVDLFDYVRYLRENGLESRRYELAFWVRIIAPLATGGMVLLAVPFVFGSMRTVSVGARIMTGALLGIGFYLFNGIFNRIGLVYELPPVVAAVLPTLVVYGLWLVMMRRVR